MITSDAMQAINDLDLAPIKLKLMHASGESWSQAKADMVEAEYRRFLYLMKAFPDAPIAPGKTVDIFWHYHILDTMKYAVDCDAAFGHFIHHYPYLGISDEADDAEQHERAGSTMRALYEQVFAAADADALAAEPSAYSYAPGAAARALTAEPSAYSYAPGSAASALKAESSAYSYAPGSAARALKAESSAYSYAPGAAARALKAESSAYSYAPGAAARALAAEPSAYSYAPGALARALTLEASAYSYAPGADARAERTIKPGAGPGQRPVRQEAEVTARV